MLSYSSHSYIHYTVSKIKQIRKTEQKLNAGQKVSYTELRNHANNKNYIYEAVIFKLLNIQTDRKLLAYMHLSLLRLGFVTLQVILPTCMIEENFYSGAFSS